MEQVSIEKKENRFVQDMLGPDDKLLIESMREFVDTEIIPVRREIEASTRTDLPSRGKPRGEVRRRRAAWQ